VAWVFYSAQILYSGAEIGKALERRREREWDDVERRLRSSESQERLVSARGRAARAGR
jgi:uncharacterized BrkB/YihY/UPF0761 family membrane protein